MKFEEALVRLTDDQILNRLGEIYSNVDVPSYVTALEELRNTAPKSNSDECDYSIGVERFEDKRDGHEFFMVSGYPTGSEEAHAIEFTPWCEWLSMDVNEDSLDQFGLLDVVVHCLWELTFLGYSNSEITGEREIVKDRLQEVEGHPKKTASEEDIRKMSEYDSRQLEEELPTENED